jgi:hypothetical protein
MIKHVEMDEKITHSEQKDENVGPVILINKFNVNPEDVDTSDSLYLIILDLGTLYSCFVPLEIMIISLYSIAATYPRFTISIVMISL